jgi:hypothetical protein
LLDEPKNLPIAFTIHVFREGDWVYEVGYRRARIDEPMPFFTRREPADEVLRDLIAGITATR